MIYSLKGIEEGHKPEYDTIFDSLKPTNGKLSGSAARPEMMKSKLPNGVSFDQLFF